jgi:bifunctional DNase/RNase
MDETVELVPVKFEKLMQSRAYACVVLGAEEKKFAIYTDLPSGKSMQLFLAATEKQRPQTHDLLARIFRGLEIKVKQVVINDVQDTIYFARIFLEQQRGDLLHIVEIDARPSDCITLALVHKAPLYCTRGVLEKTIPYAE